MRQKSRAGPFFEEYDPRDGYLRPHRFVETNVSFSTRGVLSDDLEYRIELHCETAGEVTLAPSFELRVLD